MALNGGRRFEYTHAISFKIDCADQAEVDRLWDALSANGGSVEQCGWLRDRYGVSWQIVPAALMKYLGGPMPPAQARDAGDAANGQARHRRLAKGLRGQVGGVMDCQCSLAKPCVAEGILDCFRSPDAFDEKRNTVATPEQLAIEDHGRYAEDTDLFRFIDDTVVLGPGGAVHVGLEIPRRTAERSNDAADCGQLIEFEFVISKLPENRVMVAAKNAVTLGKQHARARIECVVDAPRPLEREVLRIRIAPGVHIGVADLSPEMRRSPSTLPMNSTILRV